MSHNEAYTPAHVIEEAVPGNRKGVALAYGHAAAWLRAGKVPPDDLRDWLVERLDDMAVALRDERDKKMHALNVAVGATASGKRGRKVASDRDLALSRMLAWDCYYERQLTGDPWGAIFKRLAARVAQSGVFISETKVEAAWKDRRKIGAGIPEMES